MAGKREKREGIVTKPCQIEVLRGQDMPLADAVRQVGMTQQTYYRWRKQSAERGRCSDHVRKTLGVSERRTCRTSRHLRSTQHKGPTSRSDEELLTEDIINPARKYGRYGYRMVTGLLNNPGWYVSQKRLFYRCRQRLNCSPFVGQIPG